MALQRGADATELGGWLYAYCFRRSEPLKFRDEIEHVGRALDAELWQALRVVLADLGIPKGAELVWFPQGETNGLPVHAAWHGDASAKRYVLDDFSIRYAPALKLLRPAMPPATGGVDPLVVANPTGDLKFTALEVEWIRDACTGGRAIAGPDASKERVVAELPTSAHVHLAAHANFDIDDPFASAISLADGARLTLAELLAALDHRCPAFVALSACETAVARATSTADEFLGFPTALLAQGVHTVLATQWPVDDEATAILIGEFYRQYRDGRVPAAEALRLAQNWLRMLTNAQLEGLVRPMRERQAPVGALAAEVRIRARGRDSRACPFEHPYYWAGFTVSGGR